jgi:uncharacterized membrane protein YgaE (UPF0421/DUF939 family)
LKVLTNINEKNILITAKDKYDRGELDVEIVKNQLINVKNGFIDGIPTIIVAIILFFSLLKVFGVTEVIITPFLTIVFIIKSKEEFNLKRLLKIFSMLLLISVFSYLANINIVLCVILNLLVPTIIVYLYTDSFTPRGYFVYVMAFVFLQLMPIELSDLPRRFAALIFSIVVITLALFINSLRDRSKNSYELAASGLLNLSKQIDKLSKKEKLKLETDELNRIIYRLNNLIYSSRNYKYLVDSFGSNNYYFMLVFQKFQYVIKNIYMGYDDLKDSDILYLKELSKLFKKISEDINEEDNSVIIKLLDNFIEEKCFTNKKIEYDIAYIINILKVVLSNMTASNFDNIKENWRIPKIAHKIHGVKYNLKLDRFQLRFALRLSVVLTATFLMSRLTGLNHSYWIPMNAFLMIAPFYEDSAKRINHRILGTILGSILTFLLLNIFNTVNAHIIIIVLMTICMYSVIPSTWIMTSYTTCYGLSLATLAMDRDEAIELRIAYIFIAAIISILANKYILPNKSSYEFKLNVTNLIAIDREMVLMLRKALENRSEFDSTYLKELLIRSNQINVDIKNYKKKNEYEESFYNNLLEINKQLIHEIQQISYIVINNEDILQLDKNINEVLDNIEIVLNRIQVTLESNALTVDQIMSNKAKDYGVISKDLYFNSIVINCMNTTENMYDLVNERYKGIAE